MGIRTKLEFATKIVKAVGILHNLAVSFRDPEPEAENQTYDDNQQYEEHEGEEIAPANEAGQREAGRIFRYSIVERYF